MKRIIISLILLVLAASMVSAYSYGDDVNTIELPRVDQTMEIDFTTSITDRWMNPVDRVVFAEAGGEYFIQPIEIESDYAQLYVSTENKIVVMEPGDEASFQFGDAAISVAFLEGYTWKGHFDFAREENPIQEDTPVVVEEETQTTPKPTSEPEDESNFPWWVVAVGIAVIVAVILGIFITKPKN